MSSIRLFILSSFAQHGPMHGHRLRSEAEARHVHRWTDVTVGAVYGAMKRLAEEGLLRASGREKEGNRPTRQLYEITDQGRVALTSLCHEGLREVWFKHDPFDLALTLTRLEQPALAALPAVLAERLDKVRSMLAEARRVNEGARDHVGITKQWALRHAEYRLEAEVAYLTDLLAAAPDFVSGEQSSLHRASGSKTAGDSFSTPP